MPAMPTEHVSLGYVPLITPTNHSIQRGFGPSRPSSWEDSLLRAEKIAAATELPPNYDFPFGIPALLISTSPDPYARCKPSAAEPSTPSPPDAEAGDSTTGLEADSLASPAVAERLESVEEQAPVAAASQSSPDAEVPRPVSPSPEAAVERDFLPVDQEPKSSRDWILPVDREAELSRQKIHVVSSNIRSSYIAWALSSVGNRPPVGLILQEKDKSRYAQEGGRISVRRSGRWYTSEHLEEESCRVKEHEDKEGNYIDHLILTTRPARTARSLSTLAPRIDERTVVCLIQDGLGVPEHLNSTVFTDPATRPSYVLGHMTHLLRHLRVPHDSRDWFRYSLGEEPDSGVLNLSGFAGGSGVGDNAHEFANTTGLVNSSSLVEGFMYSMWRAPRLNVSSLSMGDFLTRKLPTMVFQSVIEPVTTLLDCDYGELCRSRAGLDQVENLLHEASAVIMALPELAQERAFLEYVARGKLRGDILGRLRHTEPTRESEMRWLVRNARPTDIDFLSGWFVRRGRELGIECAQLEMAVFLVKGKAKVRRKRAEGLIKMQNLPKGHNNHFY